MLDKSIISGKEWRKPYYRSGAFDLTCRNHGSCKYCENNRMHKHRREEIYTKQQLKSLDKVLENE